jgi:hypothetical protein
VVRYETTLLTHIATESVSSRVRMKSRQRFSNLKESRANQLGGSIFSTGEQTTE